MVDMSVIWLQVLHRMHSWFSYTFGIYLVYDFVAIILNNYYNGNNNGWLWFFMTQVTDDVLQEEVIIPDLEEIEEDTAVEQVIGNHGWFKALVVNL